MLRFFIFFFWILSTAVSAQTETVVSPKVQFGLAYLNNGTLNPGLQLNADWVFKSFIKTKKRESQKLGVYYQKSERQIALEGRLGTYWDPLSHWALFNHYLLSYRLVHRKQASSEPTWTMAVGFGPGVYRSIFPEAYEVDDLGEVTKLSLAGRGYFTTTFDFKFIRERPQKKWSAWFLGLNNIWLFNYNSTIAPISNLYFGFRFNFKSRS